MKKLDWKEAEVNRLWLTYFTFTYITEVFGCRNRLLASPNPLPPGKGGPCLWGGCVAGSLMGTSDYAFPAWNQGQVRPSMWATGCYLWPEDTCQSWSPNSVPKHSWPTSAPENGDDEATSHDHAQV